MQNISIQIWPFYSLQAYAEAQGHKIERAEYTINNQLDDILEKIYCQKPDVLIFSCYIWNIEYVRELAAEFHKLRPEVPIWLVVLRFRLRRNVF